MSDEKMREKPDPESTWFKPYFDAGHHLEKAHGNCTRCGCAAIDLYEDAAYGDIRQCRPNQPDISALVEDAWRPIETAPDCEPILVWCPGQHRGIDSAEVVVLYHDASAEWGFDLWTNGGSNAGDEMWLADRPTHWMPLPKPPTKAGGA